MADFARFFPAALFLLSAAVLSGQSGPSASASPKIIQPGLPGQPGKTLTPETAAGPRRLPAPADIEFMQGMIMHHSQAVEMTDLMPTHTHNKVLLALGQKINVSQTDEIGFMKQWLQERGQKPEMPTASMDMTSMKGMDMSHMHHDMPLMPGMLSPQQMKALAKAKGAKFDNLFLTGMIQHHQGALTMVEDLFDTPAAGQDAVLFDFATDIDNTQLAEIKIMQSLIKKALLLKEKK